MVHFYNTETFERRAYGSQEEASNFLPNGYIEYAVGEEPQELLNFMTYKTPEQIEEEDKSNKLKLLNSIVVTTVSGNTFDGDDVARADMLSAIGASETLGLTESSWKLADNSWVVITLEELKEASALAIQAKGVILSQ